MVLLVRFLMRVLKPSNKRLRSQSNGTLESFKILLYQSILKWLLKSYKHYAISDSISIDRGRIRIVHELRDLEFENELSRNNIDIRPYLLSRETTIMDSKGRHKRCFNYFKWKNLKSIYIDDKELFIKHSDSLSITGNIASSIKSSSSEDIIIRSTIELKTIQKEQQAQPIHDNIDVDTINKRKRTQHNNGLFGGDRVREREKSQNGAEIQSRSTEKQQITKRGFEIDTTF